MPPAQPPATKRPPRRRWRTVLCWVLALAFVAIGLTGAGLYRAAKQVPQFYTEALEADPVVARAAGDDLERRALDLQNEARRARNWEASFTAEQINGWLAVDLVEKFPELLPPEVIAPRVKITPDEIQLAFRYRDERLETVVSLAFSVALTEEPNVVAVRVRRARAGALPIPLKQFLDQIASAAGGADLEIRWSQVDGDPVALVRLPTEHTQLADRTFHLKNITLKPDLVKLSGETDWK